MSEKVKVKFNKNWKYAHGGIHVVSFEAGHEYDVDVICAGQAVKDGVAKPVTVNKNGHNGKKDNLTPAQENNAATGEPDSVAGQPSDQSALSKKE